MVRSPALLVLVGALVVGLVTFVLLRTGPQVDLPTGPEVSTPPISAVGEGQRSEDSPLHPIESVPLQNDTEDRPEPGREPAQEIGRPASSSMQAVSKIKSVLGGNASSTLGFMGGWEYRMEIAAMLPSAEDARRDELRAQMREHERAYYKIQEELQKKMGEFANAEMAAGRVQRVPPDGDLSPFTNGLVPPYSVGANNDGFIVLKRGYSPEFDAQIVRVFDDEVSALRDSLRESIRRVLSR